MAIPGFIVYGSVACLLGLIVFAYNTDNGCDPLAKKIIRSPNHVSISQVLGSTSVDS